MARAMARAPLSGRTRPACMSLDRATRSGLLLEQSTFGKSMPPEGTLRTEVKLLRKMLDIGREEHAQDNSNNMPIFDPRICVVVRLFLVCLIVSSMFVASQKKLCDRVGGLSIVFITYT